MQSNLSTLKPLPSAPYDPTAQTHSAQPNDLSIAIVLIFPVALILALVSYRKHRSTVRRQQIGLLNRIWQLESSKKQS